MLRRTILLVCTTSLVTLPGCSTIAALFGGGAGGQSTGVFAPREDPQVAADQRALEDIKALRTASEADPTSVAAAVEWARAVVVAVESGMYDRRSLEVAPRAGEALAALLATEPTETEELGVLILASALHRAVGDSDAELDALERAHAIDPWGGSWARLLGAYMERGETEAIDRTCEGMRGQREYDDALLELFATCMQARGTNDSSEGLPWASKGDRAWFEAELARLRAEEEARLAEQRRLEAERQAELERQRAEQAERQAAAAAAAPAGPISVDIKNNCSHTVKIFFGRAANSSGTHSSIGSNTRRSHSFSNGEQLFLMDDSGNAISSASPGPGTRELEITSSCTGIVSH